MQLTDLIYQLTLGPPDMCDERLTRYYPVAKSPHKHDQYSLDYLEYLSKCACKSQLYYQQFPTPKRVVQASGASGSISFLLRPRLLGITAVWACRARLLMFLHQKTTAYGHPASVEQFGDLSSWASSSETTSNHQNLNTTTQLNSTENYGRRCLTPLSPHRNYILS